MVSQSQHLDNQNKVNSRETILAAAKVQVITHQKTKIDTGVKISASGRPNIIATMEHRMLSLPANKTTTPLYLKVNFGFKCKCS
jgi:hypothetical protein